MHVRPSHKNHQALGGWSLQTIAKRIERFIYVYHHTPTKKLEFLSYPGMIS